MNIVEVVNLQKNYPKPDNRKEMFAAVAGISLNIVKGEIFGLLGPNGAGKTTTLEMIEGLTDYDGGSVHVAGLNVQQEPYKVKALIGVQLQANEYLDKLALDELLELFASLYGSKTTPTDVLSKVNLLDKAKARPNRLSGGQKQRFSIACALVNNPQVLFLDEPTTGLDPQAKRNLWDLVRELNKAGMTIVLTTHNMEEAEFLCDRLAIMDHGKIIAQGTPAQLIQQYAPDVPPVPRHGNLEDVFLHLTGAALRE
jgi:ABC-2 type transport system ATP-binding protein